MKKWIRIKGVAAFIIITIALILFTRLFADLLIKNAIETTGTLLIGARVELAEVDLALFPPGLTLTKLEVTNPEAPMTNAMEAGHIRLSMEALPLFYGKIIVPEISATDVRFATKRTHTGAVTPREKKTAIPDPPSDKSRLSLPSLTIRDPKRILAQESLSSVEEAQKIKTRIKALKTEYKERLAALPDARDFAAYEARIKALKSKKLEWRDVLGKAGEIKKISEAVNEDLAAIRTVREELTRDIAHLKERIEKLPELAEADYHRIKKTYGPSAQGVDNATALIFGDAYAGKVESAIRWYQKIAPLLEKKETSGEAPHEKSEEADSIPRTRGKGVTIAFKEKHPRPDFLIKKGQFQGEGTHGDLSGTLENITAQQPLVGRPLALTLSGKALTDMETLKVTATFDRVTPHSARDHLTLSGTGMTMHPIGHKETLRMKGARAAMKGEVRITSGTDLTAETAATLTDVHFDFPTEATTIQRAIHGTLKDITTVSIQGAARGTLADYTLSVSSDLDDHLKKALKNAVSELTTQFDGALREAIREKTGAPFSAANTDFKGILAMEGDLAQRLQKGKSLL